MRRTAKATQRGEGFSQAVHDLDTVVEHAIILNLSSHSRFEGQHSAIPTVVYLHYIANEKAAPVSAG
jgi:hypothetical protein